MAKEVSRCRFPVTGRGLYRDEFVTCGGVALKEVNLQYYPPCELLHYILMKARFRNVGGA